MAPDQTDHRALDLETKVLQTYMEEFRATMSERVEAGSGLVIDHYRWRERRMAGAAFAFSHTELYR